MWLNQQQITDDAIRAYRKFLRSAAPSYLVIDDLFRSDKLDEVTQVLQLEQQWQTQKHSYAALYVSDSTWQKTPQAKRFVQRDLWLRPDAANITNASGNSADALSNSAAEFLTFLRSEEFMLLLSRIFRVTLTDKNVAKPEVNTNYFRLGPKDFVNQHADDSPGREVCMLLYLNKNWQPHMGGELVFMGQNNQPVVIPPLYNRCVLFDPSSEGAEHWVKAVTTDAGNNGSGGDTSPYRYNITSWYWSE
ncbi:2OG-Fe(II) oxygenase [Rheinheimera sp.]|uniref:2OG-Fe(II) oxygenase n=1 Tax=Rheinheimera sp. TaxID=1869214 RepID=UPI0027BA40CC|nr:2OG-Fe(II) oxygenase [Rheinheimera sp.]